MGEMHSKQLAIDSYLNNLRADINQLAGTLPEILQRLEDKLDMRAEREDAGGLQDILQPWSTETVGVRGRLSSLPARKSRTSSVELESESDESTLSRARQDTERGAVRLPQAPRQKPLKRTGSGFSALTEKIGAAEPEPLKQDKPARLRGIVKDTADNALDRAVSSTTDPLRDSTGRLMDGGLGAKLESLDKKLMQIINVLVVKHTCEGDDDEDRKRLKEKLKQAIEADRRSRIRPIVSRSEVWLEYIFGICQPDQRIGKRGSRSDLVMTVCENNLPRPVERGFIQ